MSDDLGTAKLNTEVDLAGLEQGLGEAETQTQGRLAGMAEGLKGSLGLAFAGIGVALAGALAGAGVAAVDIAAQFRDAQGQMQAQLGVTADEAAALGDVAREVFGNNFGDSVEDVGQSIIEVRQQMKGLADDELAGATESALALRDAFGFEVAESTNAANVLMEKFGLTSQQAFDFITKGQQAGLNTSGDFLETLTEYGGLMADNGLSAEQFFSVMQTGLEGGVLGTDKAADAFKEFGIIIQSIPDTIFGPEGALRFELGDAIGESLQLPPDVIANVAEDADAVAEALNSIGLKVDPDMLREPLQVWNEDTKEFETQIQGVGDAVATALADGLADGSVSVAQAQQIMIDALGHIDDEVQRNSTGVALFGTMWEDMGADAILAIDMTATSMSDMEGATSSLNAQYTSLGGVWEGVSRGFLLALEPLGAVLLDLANQAMPYLLAGAENLRAGIEVAIGFIGPFIAGVVSFITGLLSGEGATSLGTWGAAFEQARVLIEGVMNGVMGIVQPILAQLSAFWATHGTEITAFATTAWNQIGSIVSGVLSILQATIIPILTSIGGFISTHSAEIQALLSGAWTIISTVIGTAIANVQSVITIALAAIQGDWGTVWAEIQGIIDRTTGAIQTVIGTMLSGVQTLWNGALGALQTKATDVWNGIKGAVETGINGAKSAIDGLVTQLNTTLTTALNTIQTTFSSVWNGVKSAIADPIGAVKNAIDSLIGKFTGDGGLSSALGGAKTVIEGMQRAFDNIKSSVQGFINVVGDLIRRLADLVIPDALQEHSPSPFEQSVRHLAGAVHDDLLPGLQALVRSTGDLTLRPVTALNGMADAAMSSASASADVRVGFAPGADAMLRQLVRVEVQEHSEASGQRALNRRKLG
jgi:phage-related minor tail protein